MGFKSTQRSSSAFTLVELMTAIVILGVLAAAAAPAYKKYVTHVKVAEAYVIIEAIQKNNTLHSWTMDISFLM
ncbi:MAG: prepilin-type N-terminal cleavage/methylation domain-containing protein [Bdellovibrionota bacterium]